MDINARGNHPNPIMFRESWINLDGEWNFSFDKDDIGINQAWMLKEDFSEKIIVPYVYQSILSGINKADLCDTVWYSRKFTLPKGWQGKKTLLHFGAVDYYCQVWINGSFAGEHTGGYSSFCLDITQYVDFDKDNKVTLRVVDHSYDRAQCRGKQRYDEKSFGCWYKQYTGIWQSVWLESVNYTYIEDIKTVTDVDSATIMIDVDVSGWQNQSEMALTADLSMEGKNVSNVTVKLEDGRASLIVSAICQEEPFSGFYYWSPENPKLYDLKLALFCGEECVDSLLSYVGMRKLEVSNGKVYLNNSPCFQRLILNQGYYVKGHITAENDEEIKKDISIIKKMGFNGMRIHEKIESARFLYWCDVMGMLVWEEMPSAYCFKENRVTEYLSSLCEIIKRDKNHPSIITWVMFNESWGVAQIRFNKKQQHFTLSAYHTVKAIDDTRFVISNDGWEHTESDIFTIHDYEADGDKITALHTGPNQIKIGGNRMINTIKTAFADGFKYSGQPIIVSEFGGISFESDTGWGYNDKVKSYDEFFERLLSQKKAFVNIQGVCGYCLTQFTDVEDEKNGLLTIDRQPKVPMEKIEIMNRMN